MTACWPPWLHKRSLRRVFPDFRAPITVGDDFFPAYQAATIVLGPLVWLGLHLLLTLVAVWHPGARRDTDRAHAGRAGRQPGLMLEHR